MGKEKVTPLKNDKEDIESEDEKTKTEPQPTPSVGLCELFKFASPMDGFLIIFALTLSFGCGCFVPIFCVLFGQTLQSFVENDVRNDINDASSAAGLSEDGLVPKSDVMETLSRFGLGMIGMAGLMWFLSYIFVSCLNLAAANQVFRIRGKFIEAVLKQDVSWYDTGTSTDFASRMTEDLNKLQEGIGEKIGMLSFFTGTFFFSMIVAFYYGWDLTLVILSMMPLMIIFGGVAAMIQSKFAEKEMEAYGKAGTIAEEVLSAIRTVVAFGGQSKEIKNYDTNLVEAKKSGILRGLLTGLSGGLTFSCMYAVFGLGFWYGVKCIMDDREGPECLACGDIAVECYGNTTINANPAQLAQCVDEHFDCYTNCMSYRPEDLLIVFFSVLIGGFQLGQSAPYVEALATARSAAGKIYSIIERIPEIDSSSQEGIKGESILGNIKFKNIFFSYPSRKDVPILRGFDLSVPHGKTVALVGSSGCGKSTCIQLVQRFYDPESGSVEVDGIDIKDLNIGWLRDQIGVVGQEPVLFDLSIRENIRMGNFDATDAAIEEACKKANAYNFIEKLPKTFDTMVGEGGTQLSGGQKQRIAIARALVRNPRILLLDEATSALDTESEKVVQEALDKARAGRTTLVVAHRLTTIRTADIIVAIDQGKVKEMGTHEELMANEGLYHSLVMRQTQGKSDGGNEKAVTTSSKISVNAAKSDNIDTINLPHTKAKMPATVKEVEEELPKIQVTRLLKRNKPEWFYILVGVLASCAMGAVNPIYAVLFGEILGVLGYEDTQLARDDSVKYAFWFLGLAAYALIAMLLQGWMFAISGENLTKRLRRDAFEAMLAQEMGWYDSPDNNTGALCARLSGDAAKVQGATGARIGSILQGIAGVLIAITMGLFYNWKLGLVCSVFFPVMIVATVAEMRIIQGVDTVEKVAFEKSAKLAIEAITNIRTIAGLRCEAKYVEMYIQLLAEPHKLTLKKSHFRGFVFGFSQATQFFAWGTTMWYGGYLVDQGEMTFEDVFKVTNVIIGGAGMVGYSFAFTADFNKAMSAAARVFQLLDRKPLIDTNSSAGLKLNQVEGNVKLKDAEFSYPTRRDVPVLRRLQLSIQQGESIALVGESGCGKSTVIQLIQRFYDLDQGSLELEGNNIEALNLPYVRSKLGIVSQEPVLFDRSIAENIRYGDNERTVSMEDVIAAARKANIHEFVAALPEGYETRVGGKGTQLSGGQKQRVAIARALVRNPRILLLDEATSALDTESEKVVQEALDKAQEGTTSITIAHRLSTIKGADQIYIIEKGEIVEHGTHDQLIEKQGSYYRLWNAAVN